MTDPSHIHVYADRVRTDVEVNKIIGGDPTWTLIEEVFTYVCLICGHRIETRIPITTNPALDRLRK